MPTDIGDDTLEQFNELTIIHTDVARIPPTDALVRYSQDQVFGPVGMLGSTLAGLRDMLGIRLESDAGVWSYPSAPNLTVFHVSAPDAGGSATILADLLHRDRMSLPFTDVSPATTMHPLVLSGVLDAVAEQLLLAPEFRGDDPVDPDFAIGHSVAGLFDEAATVGRPIRLVTTAADLDAIEADPISRGYLTAAVTSGQVIVVPVAPVDLDGTPVLGWWMIDPATGRTRDQLDNGMSGASLGFPGRVAMSRSVAAGEYTFLQRAIMWVAANARWFACLGLAAGAAFVFTGAMIRLADTAAAGGSLARMAAAGAFGAGGIAGATIGCIA